MVGNYAFGPVHSHALATNDKNGSPTTNAGKFAYMCSSAYDLGLKGDWPCYGPSCPVKWDPALQEVIQPWVASGATNRHTGLN